MYLPSPHASSAFNCGAAVQCRMDGMIICRSLIRNHIRHASIWTGECLSSGTYFPGRLVAFQFMELQNLPLQSTLDGRGIPGLFCSYALGFEACLYRTWAKMKSGAYPHNVCCSLNKDTLDFSFSYVSWLRIPIAFGNATETDEDSDFCLIVCLKFWQILHPLTAPTVGNLELIKSVRELWR